MKHRIVKLNKKIDNHGLQRVLNIYELYAINCAASVESGYKRTVVTLTADEPEPLHFFDGWSITGAEITGDQFTFVDSDVTAQANYINYYPITYESDDHATITGDDRFIPGSTGITLQTGYDTYYRISGYEVTGGTIEDGVLIPTGPCTAKIYSKPNAFTATGGWEKGSNVHCESRGTVLNNANVPAKYALHVSHTGDIPASWYSTSNIWKPVDASAYTILLQPVMQFTLKGDSPGDWARATACSLIGSTQTQTAAYAKENGSQTSTYSKSFTSTTQNVNYGISATLQTTATRGYTTTYWASADYIATATTGTWSATGYAP